MASEVEHRQRAAPKGGGTGAATTSNRGTINNLLAPPKPSQTPSQPVAKSATGRLWALINGEEDPAPPSPVGGGPQPLFRDDTDETSDEGGSSNAASPVTSPPPYWTNNAPAHAHARSVSNTSVESFLPAGAITLQDNEYDDGPGGSNVYGRDRNRACWAKSVQVTDFVIVNGSATNIGAFVVWNIKVETLNVSDPDYAALFQEEEIDGPAACSVNPKTNGFFASIL